MSIQPSDPVAAAVAALRLFHPSDRVVAGMLLSMWEHRDRLTEADRAAVLDSFPPSFAAYSDAVTRSDHGEARPGDAETVEAYERLVLNPAHERYTEAVETARKGRACGATQSNSAPCGLPTGHLGSHVWSAEPLCGDHSIWHREYCGRPAGHHGNHAVLTPPDDAGEWWEAPYRAVAR